MILNETEISVNSILFQAIEKNYREFNISELKLVNLFQYYMIWEEIEEVSD